MKRLFPLLLLVLNASLASDLADLQQSFRKPPADARPMVRWWWFGPAVVKPELEREMRQMREAGFGGFEVQPVYPLTLDDPAHGLRNLPYLSPEFLGMLSFTSDKAQELGLRMDLTLGSGWPYGGANVSKGNVAMRLWCRKVPVPPGAGEVAFPTLEPQERPIAAFLKGAGRLSLDGTAAIRVPGEGARTVLFFTERPTGMQVKRPSVGAEGPVMNHYSRAALDEYLRTTGEALLKPFGARPPYSIFCDSLEVNDSDWTGDFIEQFQKRRGYDITPYLPALESDAGPETGAVRYDWGITLTELAEERFLEPLRAWASKHHTLLRAQVYGIPPFTVSSNNFVDLPEGEGAAWNRFCTSRWAASAAHLSGRPVVSSETWTWLHSPAFRSTPLDLKAEADRHFLQGINQLIGHGWAYSPEAAGEPGWRLYAAGVINAHNPWWFVMPELAGYLQRVSFLMRQGTPVVDVALYLPAADARAATTLGRTNLNTAIERRMRNSTAIADILSAGFNLDFLDDRTVRTTPLAGRYRAVVLPEIERIPVDVYRKLEEFARSGGIVLAVGRQPQLAPGLVRAKEDSAGIQAISARLFGGARPAGHRSAPGERTLAQLVQPDVALEPAVNGIGFVHRRADGAEIYFLANTTNTAQRTQATFRVQGLAPEWWDAYTGGIQPARVEHRDAKGVTVALDLEAYDSRVLVFRHGAAKSPPAGSAVAAKPSRVPIDGPWTVRFPALDRTVQYDVLHSWTEDAATRYYTGRVTYEKTIEVKPEMLGAHWFLSFGEAKPLPDTQGNAPGMRAWIAPPIGEAAMVTVNGHRAGFVWHPPYRVDVGSLLRAGANQVEVTVGNSALNLLAAGSLPDYTPIHKHYGQRFDPQDMDNLKPAPSGLLGPVALITE